VNKLRLFFLLMCVGNMTQAHNFAPSLLELREQPGGIVELLWRTPMQAVTQPAPVLPQGCRQLGKRVQVVNGSAVEFRYSLVCPVSMGELNFSVRGLTESKTAALLRWHSLAGGRQQLLLRTDQDSFVPKSDIGMGRALVQFSALGISHILAGVDHLLFVLGLLMLASGIRQLVILITSFTLGHSISLALVSLGFIPYLPSLAEWLIALSVLLMAGFLSTGVGQTKSRVGMTVLIAGFGLLHGLGFAGVLSELLDGSSGVVSALLGFNIGIELGQLIFIAAVMAGVWLLRQLPSLRWLAGARWAAIYLMGSVSMYWLLDRGLKLVEATLDYGVY
jgi:hypothetical protein